MHGIRIRLITRAVVFDARLRTHKLADEESDEHTDHEDDGMTGMTKARRWESLASDKKHFLHTLPS